MSAEVYKLFIPEDKECIKVIRKVRWGNGYICPYCGSKDVILKGKERDHISRDINVILVKDTSTI